MIYKAKKESFSNMVEDHKKSQLEGKILEINDVILSKEKEIELINQKLVFEIGISESSKNKRTALINSKNNLYSQIRQLQIDLGKAKESLTDYLNSSERADVVSGGLYTENTNLQGVNADLQANVLEKEEEALNTKKKNQMYLMAIGGTSIALVLGVFVFKK